MPARLCRAAASLALVMRGAVYDVRTELDIDGAILLGTRICWNSTPTKDPVRRRKVRQEDSHLR
ncbi:MAG: hypothetical protein IH984_10715 [Planctomycetes bacterium]|nr:hypothetical protein [Planctomycetota bacterium]